MRGLNKVTLIGNQPALQKFVETLQLKAYSPSTITTYKNEFAQLLHILKNILASEIVAIKIEDIDSERMQVFIERAKGKKDRYVNLPESVLLQMREYFKEFRPKVYLFEGQFGGQYSVRSAQQVFSDALQKAKINKTVGIHGLRHSYATHLMESGTDVMFIQKLLGHSDIKTTLRYVHVSKKEVKNIKSPLDTM
ncbi:tyrosine-type recombinase/integrase [Arcicella sp. LKC2W]|uniref:tyrosine-type recombinase/integrase n=1 Tax=Arcicella sp. LKC2W TaxID=2984198 RepID=UPI002B1F31D0|nr:tyrosine-type recombinase/integrase [Arcicella sp. LKC2W]MEA5461656.1 tyrosine-type recombinase/integrase [Arcicella sp. LKC2W]